MKLDVQDLIDQGLVIKKTYTEGEYKGLSVLKYHRKVFYDNLWHLDDRLLECRGTVVDEDWNVLVLPFKKVFNLNENGTYVDPNEEVMVTEKVNGFMAAVTYNTKLEKVIVSTTGSLDSPHVDLAKKHIQKLNVGEMLPDYTYLFEICDESDPHIVDEEEGAYLIGIRDILDGNLVSEGLLDAEAEGFLDCKRPDSYCIDFKDIDGLNKYKEGFMVRPSSGLGEHLCKIKTPHYLSKKAIMRLGKSKVDIMFDNTEVFKKRLDEEFYDLLDYIVKTFDKEVWKGYSDQQRKTIIEEYFNG